MLEYIDVELWCCGDLYTSASSNQESYPNNIKHKHKYKYEYKYENKHDENSTPNLRDNNSLRGPSVLDSRVSGHV